MFAMSLKNLSVGLALAALSVVLAPTAGQADANMNQAEFQARMQNMVQQRSRIERSEAYRDKFKDLRMERWKHKDRYHGGDSVGVPELDPNGFGAAATLLLGGVMVAHGRRRRLALV
jgi:hypothetical protein